MIAYIARRLASTVFVMAIVAVIIFLLLRIAPGDPVAILVGDNASPEQITAIRKHMGLDDPLIVQFWRWASRVLVGDLGISIFSNEPVSKLVLQRLEPTLSLAATTILLAVLIAVSFGVLAAWKGGRFEFLPGAVTGKKTITRGTTTILLEAARRRDEAMMGGHA